MFTKAFYVNFGYPDNGFTMQILEHYLQSGVRDFVLDLPSADPYLEKPVIQENMRHILSRQGVFGVMEGISEFKSAHREVRIFLMAYLDSVLEAGISTFIDWCRKNEIAHIGLISRKPCKEIAASLARSGILPNVSAEYSLDAALRDGLSEHALITIQFGKEGTAFRASFAQRLQAVRAAAKGNLVFAEMGVSTPEDVREIQACGADGVIIGGAAMELWDDPVRLRSFLRTICGDL